MHFTALQWAFGGVAALMVGLSKTGVPGVGILVVPLMAGLFGGRLSVGALVPMLIFGDVFAVIWYRHHAQWTRVQELIPAVLVGLAAGAAMLHYLGENSSTKDVLNPTIGAIVLLVLGLSLLRGRLGESFTPRTPIGIWFTGVAGGFSTMVSNAAGPLMTIYFSAQGLTKNEFMGTSAWYYFIFNVLKALILGLLTLDNPGKPLLSTGTLLFDVANVPLIVAGAFLGRWVLGRFSQSAFTTVVLVLAAVGAVKLIVG